METPKYELMPLGEIEPIARKIAVLWVEGFERTGGIMLMEKNKLASDIMNYAKDIALDFSYYLLNNYTSSMDYWERNLDVKLFYKSDDIFKEFIEKERK